MYELEEIDSEEDAGLAKLPDRSKQSILLLMLTFFFMFPDGLLSSGTLDKESTEKALLKLPCCHL